MDHIFFPACPAFPAVIGFVFSFTAELAKIAEKKSWIIFFPGVPSGNWVRFAKLTTNLPHEISHRLLSHGVNTN
jgi:hypothetical protein